ncbi:hypothetical protein [Nonomuraea rubra]|uniref:hypothetical protein n=1 Tax=Nonomuraea rubra TaxID=46180 RepID=UPI0033DF468B
MRISAALLATTLIACAPAAPAAADVPFADPDRVCVTVPVQSLAQAFTNFFTSGTTAGTTPATTPPARLFGFELPREVRVLEAASC